MSQELQGFTHFYRAPKNGSRTVFVTLHGTGGSEHDLVPLVDLIDPDAGIISPLGKVREGNAARFFRRVSEGVFDEEDIELRAKELVQFINKAAEQYGFDRAETIWLGYSNGANMISSLMLLHPDVVKNAALLRPMVTIIPENLPTFADVYILMASGTQDSLVPVENTEKLIRLFQHSGAIVELFLNDAGHSLDARDEQVLGNWYAKRTGIKTRSPEAPERIAMHQAVPPEDTEPDAGTSRGSHAVEDQP
jgi:phospholipase/carboxylesterase